MLESGRTLVFKFRFAAELSENNEIKIHSEDVITPKSFETNLFIIKKHLLPYA